MTIIIMAETVEKDNEELQKHMTNDEPDWIVKRLIAKTSVLKMADCVLFMKTCDDFDARSCLI